MGRVHSRGQVRWPRWASLGSPFWEKPLKLTVKIRYTEKIFDIDRENQGFLRKRSPFKMLGCTIQVVRANIVQVVREIWRQLTPIFNAQNGKIRNPSRPEVASTDFVRALIIQTFGIIPKLKAIGHHDAVRVMIPHVRPTTSAMVCARKCEFVSGSRCPAQDANSPSPRLTLATHEIKQCISDAQEQSQNIANRYS
jgi:hypothetical protein